MVSLLFTEHGNDMSSTQTAEAPMTRVRAVVDTSVTVGDARVVHLPRRPAIRNEE